MKLKHNDLHSLIKDLIEEDDFHKDHLKGLYASKTSVQNWSRFIDSVLKEKNLRKVLTINSDDINKAVKSFQSDAEKLKRKKQRKKNAYNSMDVYTLDEIDEIDIV